ncbi:MAG: CAP domain-containing protein [Planctomycetota bacterium]|nr:CAP domain-containing protein [Planctomycetota bacterium]MDG2143047.1 CAP domain-containing protein [Planctomycetota bacterium]
MSLNSALLALTLSTAVAAISGTSDEVAIPLPADPVQDWSWVEGKKDKRWYALTQVEDTFNVAEGEALVAGGHLVTIESKRESTDLLDSFGFAEGITPDKRAQSMWIGLRRRVVSEDYVWTSGATKYSVQWAQGHPSATPESSAWATLIAGGDEAGEWREVTDPELRLYGIIEIDFDPNKDPLIADKAGTRKAELALESARQECLAAALEGATKIDIEGARKELAALRKEKADIIHARKQPTSAETVAASNAVQEWIDQRIELWGKESRRVRLAIGGYIKSHEKVAKGQRYPMTERAARTSIFSAMLDPKEGAYSQAVRYQNRRIALRTNMTNENFQIVSWTNEHRQVMGVRLLQIDSRITYGAQIHADDMSRLGFFEHDSPVPGRGSFWERCAEGGYSRSIGENIHQGYSAGISSVMGWISSPGHHSNMLHPGHGTIGPGVSPGYSVQVFGAPPRSKR